MGTDNTNTDLYRRIKALEQENAELKTKISTLNVNNGRRDDRIPGSQTGLLQERADRLFDLFECTGDGILVYNRESRTIALANQALCNTLGYRLEELIGMNVQNAQPYALLPLTCAQYRQVETGGQGLFSSMPMRDKTGAIFYADIQASLISFAGVDYCMVNVRDVTERRQTEEELKLNEMCLNSLLELSQKAFQLDEQEITRAAIVETIRLTRSEFGCIYFPNRDEGPTQVVTASGETKTACDGAHEAACSGCFMEEEDGPWVSCFRTLQPVIQNRCSRTVKDLKIKRFISVPVLGKNEIDLAICVANKPEGYGKTDIKQLQLIGYQLVRILKRRQAEVFLQRQAKEQTALYEVTSVASSFLDPDNLLETTLNLVMNLPDIGADSGMVILLEDWPQNNPRLVASKGRQVPMSPDQLMAWERRCPICAPLLTNDEPPSDTVPTAPCSSPAENCPGRLGMGRHIAFPIRVSNRALGIVVLGWRQAIPFSHADYTLLMAIGRQVGLALRNAQLYQAAVQSDRLQLLNAISTAAGSSLEVDVVLSQVLDLTCKAVQATNGSFLLANFRQGCLTFVQSVGPKTDGLIGERLNIGQGISGWVAEHRQWVCANDVSKDSRWYGARDEKCHYHTRSLLSVPMFYRGELTGVIEMVNKRHGDFTQEDISLLESVGAITGVALENARLFAATRARAQELETLTHIGMTLNASLDFDGVVQSALSQIQQLFHADGVALLKMDEAEQRKAAVRALLNGRFVEVSVRMPVDENSAVARVISRGEAVLIQNESLDYLFQEHENDPSFIVHHGSVMLAPMVASNKVIGAMMVGSTRPGQFTQANLHTLQAIVPNVTMALENAGLYENMKTLLREREQAQESLVQATKMAALGRLSASLAHEINNPLQAIQGCLTLFSEEMNGAGRQEKLNHYLAIVQGEIERITTIVGQTREYYRPEKKGVQTIDLHNTLDAVLELASKQLQQNHVVVKRNWASRPIELQANQDRLKQVFLNLIINAMDAMPEGGILVITTHLDRIERKSGMPTAAARIEFKDNGIGIDPDIQANIFEPFFTTKETGSGLGLSIVYGIIQAHQGEIKVSSRPGLGTMFSILLPLEQD